MRIVLVTAPPGEGEKIADTILEERLAACVNILPKVTSKYWWEGAIQKNEESILFIKTREDLLDSLFKRIKSVHPYSVPEMIALEVREGSPEYMRWIEEVTRA